MTENNKLKPGISSIEYNKELRLFETVLVNGKQGPDISVDAIIAKDNTIKKLINDEQNLESKSSSSSSRLTSVKSSCDNTISGYNKSVTSAGSQISTIKEKLVMK